LRGNTLYGTTEQAARGADRKGTVFKVDTDGSNYTVLKYSVATTEGYKRLVLSGDTLFGTTYRAEVGTWGRYNKVNTDGRFRLDP